MNEVGFDPSRLRIGFGFDVHPWSDDESDPLVLGGVHFADHRGLRGHSDADAIAHACTDAVLGAAGLGDIGQLFPDTDEALAGADSLDLLATATTRARAAGWRVINVDCTVVTDRPKISPVRLEMQQRLSEAAGAPVTVKGKRSEGVESFGDAVHSHAVALLYDGSASGGPIDPEDQEFSS